MHTYRKRISQTKQKAHMKIQTKVNKNCLVPSTSNVPNTVHRRTFPIGGRTGPQSDIWMGLESWLPGCQNEGNKMSLRWSLCINAPRVSPRELSQKAVWRHSFSPHVISTSSHQLWGNESHTPALISIGIQLPLLAANQSVVLLSSSPWLRYIFCD